MALILLCRRSILSGIAAGLLLALATQSLFSSGRNKQPNSACIPIAEALQQTSPTQNDICIQAHIYGVVELLDGTRFLDVCPPATSDENCRFLLMSLREDREEVGDLRRFHNQDVHIRGAIRMYRGRFGIRISHARQFEGGPEKFRPNPKLLHDFNGQSDRMPVRDPALRSSGRHRSFMDRTDHEELPTEKKP